MTPTVKLLESNTPVKCLVINSAISTVIGKIKKNFLLILMPTKHPINGTIIRGSQKLAINQIRSKILSVIKRILIDIIAIATQAKRAIINSVLSFISGQICLQISLAISVLVVFKKESCVDMTIANIPAIINPITPLGK